MATQFEKAAHLWRRAGFGATGRQLQEAVDAGLDATIDRLLDFERDEPLLEEGLTAISADLFDLNNSIDDLRTWWLYRMVNTSNPLREKLTLFWHGHFATSQAKVDRSAFLFEQNQLFRRLAGAPFRDLLTAVSQDPAMLVYLDGNSNRKGRPNENFARELLELFGLGIGNYTENDVRDAARAFTGWGTADGAFRFDPKQHDAGEKRVLGRTGNLDGHDVLDAVAAHPATPAFLASKLCRFFVNDDPDPAMVERVAEAYRRTGGHVRAMVEAVFRDPSFFDEPNIRAIVKSPVEYEVSCLRVLSVKMPLRNMLGPMRRMGQSLFAPPSVKGWDGGSAWLTSGTLFERTNFAMAVSSTRGMPGEARFDPRAWMRGRDLNSVDEVVDALAFDVLQTKPSTATRAAIVGYLTPDPPESKSGSKEAGAMAMEAAAPMGGKSPLDPRTADVKLRGALRLLLSSPEFQLA